MRHREKTPPFRGPGGEVVSGSIAEIAYRRLGGLDQWVMIRGESVANPALILLHGGPGLSETGFFRHFNARLHSTSRREKTGSHAWCWATRRSKQLVWFDESGHEPFVDEPAKFNAAMAELVRPVLSSDLSARAA